MSDDLVPMLPVSRPTALGDRIRSIAGQLRQESQVQIQATSRILSAAAKLAENHDHLIDEVVEMVEDDLSQPARVPYTVEQLKQQFGKLNDAKAHFGIKASTWAALAAKLNESIQSPPPPAPQASDSQRLAAIEQELQVLRGEMHQVLELLNLIVGKLS